MYKKTKKWLIARICLICIGVVVFGGVMTMLNWDFRKLSTVEYETNTHEVNSAFVNIALHTNTADITFIPSADGSCKVVCLEEATRKHTVTTEDGTLKILSSDERKWYEHIGIHFRNTKITVYLPGSEYGTLSVQASTGDTVIAKDFQFESIDIAQSTGDVTNYASATGSIQIKTSTGKILTQGISASKITLSASTGSITASDIVCEGDVSTGVSTGKTNITNIRCQSFSSGGNTGDIALKNVIATGKFSIERSTGDIHLDGCDASEITIQTDTGDVRGTLLSEKVFIAQTDTGRVDVPKTTSGGKCEITTDTGDIKIAVN